MLGALGGAVAVAMWVHYLWLIPQERVPERPIAHQVAACVAIALGLSGYVVDPGFGSALVAASVGGLAGFFLWLLAQAALPDGRLVVGVGDPLPDFTALDHTGELRSIREWRGKRVLLKFFRGHW